MNNQLSQYYNQKQDYGINSLRRQKINALAAAEIKSGHQNILDLGCAGGYVSKDWRTNGNQVIGLDISERSVSQAKKVLDQAFLFDLEAGDWPESIRDDKFNLILSAEILEHLFSPKDFLERLKPMMADNGIIIITTPNFLVWNNRIRLLLGRYGPKEIFYDPGHIHLFSYHSLKWLLHDLDFKIIAEDNIWYPNYLEKFAHILPPNLFVYQAIIKLKL